MTDDNTAASVPNKINETDYLSAMLAGHHLALSIKDAWASCVKTAVEPLVEKQGQIGATSFDKDTLFDVLIGHLSEFFKGEIADLADEMFSHDFVQAHTEIATIVANALPNDVAANYDLDALRHSLRETVDDFANRAKRLPRWGAEGFDKAMASFKGHLQERREEGARKGPLAQITQQMHRALGLENERPAKKSKKELREQKVLFNVFSTKKDKKKIVQFARDQVGLLIDDLWRLAKDTEGKLVEAALAPASRP